MLLLLQPLKHSQWLMSHYRFRILRTKKGSFLCLYFDFLLLDGTCVGPELKIRPELTERITKTKNKTILIQNKKSNKQKPLQYESLCHEQVSSWLQCLFFSITIQVQRKLFILTPRTAF